VLDLYQREREGQPLGDDQYVLSADEKSGVHAGTCRSCQERGDAGREQVRPPSLIRTKTGTSRRVPSSHDRPLRRALRT
jgi:hypothetical protein